MEHKEAADILIKLLDKDLLDKQEKEAVLAAIGVLSWTSLAQTRIRGMRSKRDRLMNGNSRRKKKPLRR